MSGLSRSPHPLHLVPPFREGSLPWGISSQLYPGARDTNQREETLSQSGRGVSDAAKIQAETFNVGEGATAKLPRWVGARGCPRSARPARRSAQRDLRR